MYQTQFWIIMLFNSILGIENESTKVWHGQSKPESIALIKYTEDMWCL